MSDVSRIHSKSCFVPKNNSTQAKKKLKQGKISTFFSAKPTKQQEKQKKQPEPASAAEPTAPDGDGVATAAPLPGGRSGLDVLSVRFGIGGNAKHNQEGRSITVEYEKVRERTREEWRDGG